MLKSYVAPYPVDPSEHLGVVSGRWYSALDGAVAAGSASANNTLYAYPFTIRRPVTIQSLGWKVTAAGTTSAIKGGIWRNDLTTGRPTGTALVARNTDTATTSTGGQSGAVAANGTAMPGAYWFVSLVNTGGAAATHLAVSMSDFSGPSRIGADTLANLVGAVTGNVSAGALSASYTYASTDVTTLDLTSATWGYVTTSICPVGYYQAA